MGSCAQCSYSTFSPRPSTWTNGVKFRSSVAAHMGGRMGKLSSKNYLQSREQVQKEAIPSWYAWKTQLNEVDRGQPFFRPKGKFLKVSSFKGNAQSDEVDGESKFSKKPVKLSCSHQEREETGSSGSATHPLLYASEDRDDTLVGSQAIQRLLKKWLIMLRTQTLSETNEIYRDKPAETKVLESQHGVIRSEAQKVLKATFVYFMQLDAAIKVPPLIFIPWYLTVRVMYGTEVTRELTPLWIIGPLIVALYIKIIQGLCSLYVHCFKQTVRLLVNLPNICSLAYSYIAEGKLNALLDAYFWQPIRNVKNLDYAELLRRQLKQWQEWIVEMYLDYRESIWPNYCRTIRFLKKANLI